MSIETLRMLKEQLQTKKVEEDLKKINELNDNNEYFLMTTEFSRIKKNNSRFISWGEIRKSINMESSVEKVEEKLKSIINLVLENGYDFNQISIGAFPDFYINSQIYNDIEVLDDLFSRDPIDMFIEAKKEVVSKLPTNILPGIVDLEFFTESVMDGKSNIAYNLTDFDRMQNYAKVGTVYFDQFVQTLNRLGYEVKTVSGLIIKTFNDLIMEVFNKNLDTVLCINADFNKEYDKSK